MSNFAHGVHAAHKAYELIEKTPAGHRMTAVAVRSAVVAARVLGGASAAAAAATAAPVVVPLMIVGGLGYLFSKTGKAR